MNLPMLVMACIPPGCSPRTFEMYERIAQIIAMSDICACDINDPAVPAGVQALLDALEADGKTRTAEQVYVIVCKVMPELREIIHRPHHHPKQPEPLDEDEASHSRAGLSCGRPFVAASRPAALLRAAPWRGLRVAVVRSGPPAQLDPRAEPANESSWEGPGRLQIEI